LKPVAGVRAGRIKEPLNLDKLPPSSLPTLTNLGQFAPPGTLAARSTPPQFSLTSLLTYLLSPNDYDGPDDSNELRRIPTTYDDHRRTTTESDELRRYSTTPNSDELRRTPTNYDKLQHAVQQPLLFGIGLRPTLPLFEVMVPLVPTTLRHAFADVFDRDVSHSTEGY
jgi:hypothetical protein